MHEFRNSIYIAANWERIWEVLSDVERWPEWTPSVTLVRRLDAAPTIVGSRFLVHQPKMHPAVWQVTWWEPGRRFVWTASGFGLNMLSDHEIVAVDAGCTVNLYHRFEGVFEPIVEAVSGSLITQNLAMDAAGLKARCEWR
jgi:hypothetical protein